MSLTWHHRVSESWMNARRDVLTATEIKSLIPEYKRFKKKADDEDDIPAQFAALWAEKNSDMPGNLDSYGAAARGHVMEPWAIDSWNKQNPKSEFYHWDDCIIKSNGIGFSPDAMCIPQVCGLSELLVSDDGKMLLGANGFACDAPEHIMEIKSYEPGHHMKCVLKKRRQHDEIVQIAAAFAVLPRLKTARLLFFCPSAPISMWSVVYERDDLKNEIERCEKIAKIYEDVSAKCETLAKGAPLAAQCTEEEVLRRHLEDSTGIFTLK